METICHTAVATSHVCDNVEADCKCAALSRSHLLPCSEKFLLTGSTWQCHPAL